MVGQIIFSQISVTSSSTVLATALFAVTSGINGAIVTAQTSSLVVAGRQNCTISTPTMQVLYDGTNYVVTGACLATYQSAV